MAERISFNKSIFSLEGVLDTASESLESFAGVFHCELFDPEELVRVQCELLNNLGTAHLGDGDI